MLHPFPLFVYHPNEIMVECVGAMLFFGPGLAEMIMIGYINPIVQDG